MSTANDPWGRVDESGTVFVRTAEGEREVGSWQAGSPEEALDFFKRKFASLETEVALLEQRFVTTDLSPAQAQSTIERLLSGVKEARAVGDLDSLRTRLEALTGQVDSRREEAKAAREHARHEASEIKERIVAEAERIVAEATHWKVSGERMRQLLEEWKAAPHADRAIETALWKRFSAARNAFTKRRKAYFAGLEGERETAKARKEKLCAEAEALAASTDWGPTASAFRDLMRSWKEAGRAGRTDEETLWERFKIAQDQFFQARSSVYSAKEAELREHAKVKEGLLAEAEALLPASDLRSARTAMRSIQERWEKAGSVPRDAREHLESGLRRVEDALRKAEDNQWRRSNPEAVARAQGTVAQIKATIDQLEKQLAKAHERGDAKAESSAAEALAARREWLAEAERTLAEFSS
ncbi:MAG TPA: DUF349 domain-containing protein [Streptosporangiaceae bacterium]